MRTKVAIVGAGPAGLMLGQLLSQMNISNIIVESRSREYVEGRSYTRDCPHPDTKWSG